MAIEKPYGLEMTCKVCELRDRHTIANEFYIQFMRNLDSMFKWKGLPKTIPAYILERYLMNNGWCGIGKAKTKLLGKKSLYCFFGGLGSYPNEYYEPTQIIMANPVLGSKTYTIGEDVVWAKNDAYHLGLRDVVSRYSHLLADNDISINIAQVTSRIPFLLTAETDTEIESAKQFLKDAEAGKLGIIKSLAFNKGVTPYPTQSTSSGDYLKALIELHQYLKAQRNIDVGIDSAFNMKRERQNEAEVQSNMPQLLPLADEMLKFRKQICRDVKELFDEDWDVEFNSAWKLENKQQELQVEILQHQIDNPTDSSQLEDEPEEDKEEDDE